MGLKFVPVETTRKTVYGDDESRTVTLAYDETTKKVRLLGALEHCTIINVNQALVDALQSIVDAKGE